MSEEEVIKRILQLVEDHGCIKAVELITRLPLIGLDLVQLLEKLVQQNKLVEIEYVTPKMDYRIKSIYMPANTKINVKNGNSI